MVLLIPAFVLTLWAQAKVRSAYARFSQVAASSGLTGAEAAERLLAYANVPVASGPVRASLGPAVGAEPAAVRIALAEGELSDNYDPRTLQVNLSRDVYYGRSLAALGIAAHEVGHSLQHHYRYGPLALRSGLIPLGNFGQALGPIVFLVGLFLRSQLLMDLGIIAFSGALALVLITLPVEFNASSRALAMLRSSGLVTTAEERGVRQVLTAAALTYVALAALVLMQLVRLLLLRSAADRD